MANGFLPTRDVPFAEFAAGFSAGLSVDPLLYGITPEEAAELEGLVAAYTEALAVAQVPATRTTVTVAAKRSAKDSLERLVRSLVGRASAFPGVTPAQRTALGIHIRAARSPIPAPTTGPVLILDVPPTPQNRTVQFRLMDEAHPTRAALPPRIVQAQLFTFVTATPTDLPPADLSRWCLARCITRHRPRPLPLPATTPPTGGTLWLTARWQTARGLTGPRSIPLAVHVPPAFGAATGRDETAETSTSRSPTQPFPISLTRAA